MPDPNAETWDSSWLARCLQREAMEEIRRQAAALRASLTDEERVALAAALAAPRAVES